MYEYKFVRMEMDKSFFKLTIKPEENYQEIIKSHAQKGWRFKQVFAPATTGHGAPNYFDLIFEKEI